MQFDTFSVYPNLAEAISGKGITRKELAAALGMSLSTLGRRLRGSVEFRWNELYRLHELFPDVPMSFLLQRSTHLL